MEVSKTTRQVFEDLLAQMRDQAEKEQFEYYGKIKAMALEWDGKTLGEYEKTMRQKFGYDWFYEYTCRLMRNFLRHGSFAKDSVLSIAPEVDKMIADWVQRDLREMFEGFITKNTKKTDDIIKGRSVNVRGEIKGNLECYLVFELNDRARFGMQCQIVWCVSPKGNPFWRFPTTFHTAFKADGTKIGTPSEAKLKREL